MKQAERSLKALGINISEGFSDTEAVIDDLKIDEKRDKKKQLAAVRKEIYILLIL